MHVSEEDYSGGGAYKNVLVPDIHQTDITTQIGKCPIGKAAGPSGISNRHLKYIEQCPAMLCLMQNVFNKLLNEPLDIDKA